MNKHTPTQKVDLGLPSGLLWAKCNVGAKSETDFGEYFSWGNTDIGEVTRQYNAREYERPHIISGTLSAKNDAATIQMGAGWRMPTKKDFEELKGNTNCGYTTINGVAGCQFISKKDESKYIFIPAGGYIDAGGPASRDSYCNLWLADVVRSNIHYTSNFNIFHMESGFYGMNVRGVFA